MTRGQGDTKACERRQKAEAREATMEAKQSGTSATATVGRRRKSLDAQGLPEQHDGWPQIQFSRLGALCGPGATPLRATGPISPPWACGWGAANPASAEGVQDSVTAIDDPGRIRHSSATAKSLTLTCQ
jgi:hypothetical protein